MKAYQILVSGGVQRVFFRYNTKKKAEFLQLTGCVRNKPDGQVEIIINGPEEKTKEMIDWLQIGPPYAKVSSVKVKEIRLKKEYNEFKIL